MYIIVRLTPLSKGSGDGDIRHLAQMRNEDCR